LSKKVKLELWDGSHKVWEGDKAMTGAKMMFKNQMCSVTALPQNDGFVVRIDGPTLTSAPPMPPEAQPVGPIRKVGFEYYPFPLLQKKSK
jgi:hypothetical protein